MLNSIPEPVLQGVQKILSVNNDSVTTVKNFSFCGGGCINHGGRLETTSGNFFLKWNNAAKLPGMFEAEAKGLDMLQKPNAIGIPKVKGHGIEENYQFLLLNFIESKQRSKTYWNDLGRGLAGLHKITSSSFGLDHSNYIGSLRQFNDPETSWLTFFIEKRLQVQVQFAADKRALDHSLVKEFENFYKKLPDLIPDEKPSLLHGDLWSGNVMTDGQGKPWLIDPAVYYGHREMDLAMTHLFGGFDQDFYESYGEMFPLIPGFEKRVDILNLYPLMVHVNLFGGSYRHQVQLILRRYR
jgi:fructosamine-3-kinase